MLMHIILLFTFGYSLRLWKESGSLDRELEFYKKLSKDNNIKFTFVTYGDEEEIKFEEDIEVFPIYNYIKKRKSKKLEYLQSFYYPFLINKNIHNFDIIKQNQLLGSWVAIGLKLLTNKKLFIRTGYDMYRFSVLEEKSTTIKFLYKILTRFSLFFSDLYSVSSLSDLNYLKEKFNKGNIILRPNWVKELNYNKLENRNNLEVLTVGRLEKQKNFEEIIMALVNTNYSLVIYGDGREREKLITLAKENNVNLEIKDVIPYSELLSVYQNHKIFVSSSSFEGNSKAILEAMSSGCIVIAKYIDNNKELINSSIDGYLYKNTDELNKLLKQIDNNISSQKKISKNAMKRVFENNNISNLIDLEIEDFKKLLD